MSSDKTRFREEYREGRKDVKRHGHRDAGIFSGLLESSKVYKKFKPGEIAAIANAMMNEGQREGDLFSAITGAELYEKMGRGNRGSVRRRLINAYERAVERGSQDDYVGDYDKVQIDKFLERNPSIDLGRNSLVIGFLLAGIVGVLFLSPNFTGNVIGNLSLRTSNLIGGFLFFFVIVGISYLLNKKKISFISKKQTKRK